MRKWLRITAIVVSVPLIFLWLMYFGENRLSLMLNQGTSVPYNLENISIAERRGLNNLLTGIDSHGSAECVTTNKSLQKWLVEQNFELIHCPGDSGKVEFYSTYEALPEKIRGSKIGYGIQLEWYSTNTRHITVTPVGEEKVKLQFSMDWN
jgi:hypothetical protein